MIELFGIGPALILLFVSFGFMVGVLFGFFGMGGSFLITPTLLILGYPASVAIGSGLAFYFGTSVIAVVKHADIGQVDYTLGAVLFLVLAIGIEAGSRLIFALEALGIAEVVTGSAYVLLLAGMGALFLRRARRISKTDGNADADTVPAIAQKIQSYRLPPMISLVTGGRASIWTIGGTGGIVGLISGFLGVGGGFIRMPAIYYVIGMPLTAAVGTSLFAGLFSGAFGTLTYGLSGSVNLVVVALLLLGSVFGARIGSAATTLLDEDEVIVYFGIMMVLASAGIGLSEVATWLDLSSLELVSVTLLVGSAFAVGSIILVQFFRSVRARNARPKPSAGGAD